MIHNSIILFIHPIQDLLHLFNPIHIEHYYDMSKRNSANIAVDFGGGILSDNLLRYAISACDYMISTLIFQLVESYFSELRISASI